MEVLLKHDKISSSELIKILEKNVAILKLENHHSLRIDKKLEIKLTWFNDISRNLADKLHSLWSLAETRYPVGDEIKRFADQISSSWKCLSKQISENYSKIRMASRALQGVPLSLLLDKLKKEVVLIKVSLQIHKAVYSQECILKGCKLIMKIEELLNGLEKCDNKLQQYLSVSKMTPQLIKLDTLVDKYVSNVQLLSTENSEFSDLSVFSVVVKLLTGELLGHKPINPNLILIENAPKKPVFIIKNIKRQKIFPYYPT